MHSPIQHNQESDAIQKSQSETVQTKQKSVPGKQGNKTPIQSKQGELPPIKSAQGSKPPIQAKQRPIQRNQTKGDSSSSSGNEAQIKANVSSITGTDVSNANIHYNSDKPAQLNAVAYAQGNDIHMSSSPGSDNHTLAHELTHNAQQQTGQVKATMQANNGIGINNDPKLEKHADDVAAKAISMAPAQMKSVTSTSTSSFQNAPIQGFFYDSVEEDRRISGAALNTVIEEFKKSSQYTGLVTKYTEEAKVLDAIRILTVGDYYNAKLISNTGSYLNEETYVSIASAVSHVIDTNEKADQNYKALAGKTFTELIDLTKSQADWHTQELGHKDRGAIRWAVSFVQEDNIATTLGSFKVDDFFKLLETTSSNEELLDPLREYAKVTATGVPIELDAAANLTDAKEVGERLILIQNAVPSWMINKNLKKDIFKHFSKAQITELKNYYDNSHLTPYFQSNTDFIGFLDLTINNSKNPVDYDGTPTKGHIRNYHRFHKAALDQLALNFNDTSKAKPLTLIVHGALDHNGAFVRDPKLTALIQNSNLLTLMLEGKESMAAYTGAIDNIASTYGKNDKIDQVMLAGHGAATNMQMGGKVEEDDGKVKEVGDGIDIKNNLAATKALFDKLLDNMNQTGDVLKEEHRRILFNACLTNSVKFTADYNGDATHDQPLYQNWIADKDNEATTRTKMQQWLANNHNLVSYMTERAADKGAAVDKVVGSMASHGQLDMFDPANDKLEMISADDPYLTAADKKDYVINGQELEGVLSALAVCWTNNDPVYRQEVFDEVKTRANKGSKDWQNAIIECMFSLLKDNPGLWGQFHVINGLTYLASAFLHAKLENECSAHAIKVGVLNGHTFSGGAINFDYLVYFYNKLQAANEWTANDYIPFCFYQAFAGLGDDRFIPLLLQHIDAKYATVKDIRQHLAIHVLQNGGDLSKYLTTNNKPASLKIALASVIYGPADAKAVEYLKAHTTDSRFNAPANIPDLVAGSSTEDDVLIKLGLKAAPENEASNALASDTPNVTLVDSSKVFVEPVTMEGVIKADSTPAYQNSDESSTKLADLAKDANVYILGARGAFWAIEHVHASKQATAFVKKDAVKDEKSLTVTP